MIKNKEYLKYFQFHFLNLSSTKKKEIRKLFIENKIVPTTTNEANHFFQDNTLIDDQEFVEKCILQHKKAIIEYQKKECLQNYKYSIYYTYKDEINLDLIHSSENISLYDKIEYLNEESDIKNISFHQIDGTKYFKVTFKMEKFDTISRTDFYSKLTFIISIDEVNKIFEIRYSPLNAPFKSNQVSYLNIVKNIVAFLNEALQTHIEFLDLSFIESNLSKIKDEGYILESKEAQYDDSGSATMKSNNLNKLPYIDEINELLESKSDKYSKNPIELNVFNEIKSYIQEFIKGKEEEARHKWIIILIDTYKTKFIFYHEQNMCIVHHEYINTNHEGRLDYVKGEIFRIKKLVDSK